MTLSRSLSFKSSLLALLVVLLATPLAVVAEGPAFDVKPVPVKTPPPTYPLELKREGISGLVAVKVVIDVNGTISEATVSKSTDPRFDAAAIEAVKKWKFKPAQKDGAPVAIKMIIPIQFQVNE